MKIDVSNNSTSHLLRESGSKERTIECSDKELIEISTNGSLIDERETSQPTEAWRPPAAKATHGATFCSKEDCLYIVEGLAKLRYGTSRDHFLTKEEFSNLYKCIKAWFGAKLQRNNKLIFDDEFELELYSMLSKYKYVLSRGDAIKVIFSEKEINDIKFLLSYVRMVILNFDIKPPGGSGGGVSHGRERTHGREGPELG